MIVNLSYSQINHKLGKVTIDELKQTAHSEDSTASAAILFKTGTTKFNYIGEKWEIVTTVNYKIKIYKKQGLKFADFSIPYYVTTGGNESVSFSDAFTYNLVDNKIVKTRLKSESEFKTEISENWMEKKISFPNVKEGSIIEFSYDFKSPYITTFNDFRFQSSIPTDYVEYECYIPAYFVYRTYITGYENIDVNTEAVSRIDYKENKFTYNKYNLPAIVEENYVDNIDNYTSILKFELASINYPNRDVENYSLDWQGATKKIYENENFGNELNKKGYYNDDLDILLKNTLTDDEKIDVVFNYVKSKVKWDKKNGILCKNGVKKAYKDGIGNVAEINLMLVSMLRYANFEANPILVSTRENGISLYPSRTAFNYVICGVEVNKKVILLDATDKNTVQNILPERAINWVGRIIRKDGTSSEIDLKQNKISNNSFNAMITILDDGSIEGKVREQHNNYSAYNFRNKFGDISKESYAENLEKRRNNIEISDLETLNKNDLTNPITENYNFKIENGAEKIGNKLLFSPLFFYATKENPFKQEKRKFPIDFVYPFQDKYIININIPEGYKIESLPTQTSLTIIDNLVKLKYLITSSNNKIQLLYNLDINASIISFDYYEDIKSIFNEMILKENEKIVLVKI